MELRYLLRTPTRTTLTYLLEEKRISTALYTFRPLSHLTVFREYILRIGVTMETDWASTYASIHPNDMINAHFDTHLVVMLVDVY